MAVHSAGEGHPGLRLVRFTPAAGTTPLPGADLDLYPFGPVWVSWLADGQRAALVSPCALGQRDRPCEGISDQAMTGLYLFDIAQGKLIDELVLPKLTAIVKRRTPSTMRLEASASPVVNDSSAPNPRACRRITA